jgi:hypothetical protein
LNSRRGLQLQRTADEVLEKIMGEESERQKILSKKPLAVQKDQLLGS